MTPPTKTAEHPKREFPQQAFELADGTRLVPQGEATPARVEGDCDHAFTLADVIREGGEPFAGYTRLAS
jgi:hypothetical protein